MIALDHVQIAMPAGGVSAARAFFGDPLGLPEMPKLETLVSRGGCWFALGDRELYLGVEADFRPARKAHVALATDDLDALLTAAGHEPTDDAPAAGRRHFLSAYPFGNRIEPLQLDPTIRRRKGALHEPQ